MATSDTVDRLLDRYPRTHAEEAGIRVDDKPAALFQLLYAALLFSARISTDLAVDAARALRDAGWTTPDKLAASTWEARAKVLNEAGYARFDERTSTMLGQAADLANDRYGGDLRRLRDAADREPERERALLQEFKGIGEVGADIFCREVQGVWPELYPFADKRALDGARNLDLPADVDELARLCDRAAFPRLAAALVRADADSLSSDDLTEDSSTS